jgi:hypothetical protein
MRCCRYGIPVVVIHIPFVLLYVTVQLHRCPAAMPHVVSRLSLLLCCASLSLCVCFHSCCWVCSCISTSVSNVEMNQVPDKDMPTCANTQRHPTRPVMCNGMIIIIDHFITMTPLRSIPPQHRTLAGPIRPHAQQYRISNSATPTDLPGICRRRYCTTQTQVLCKRVRNRQTVNPAKACGGRQR